jgi:cell division protein FtsZ
MGSAIAEGTTRAKDAIISALDSPLLNDNKITGAKNVLLLIVSGTNEITLDEIGEINDHIQSEAGFNANIIMGVGEDESLGDAIAVTVIATGFDLEQQNEIVNSEPKKIIHALEDEQKITHNLSNSTVPAFDLDAETPGATEERIVFELLEEEAPVVAEVAEPVVAAYEPITNENDLIVMSEFIKNLDVTFEIVSPINDIDFTFTTPEAHAIETAQPKAVQIEEQATFSFDLPLFTSEPAVNENKVVFELTDNEIKDINVVDPIQFVPVTEVAENGVIRHSLEEYMETEHDFAAAATIQKVAEVVPEELNITMKAIEESTINASEFESISPMEMTIEETLRARADERRRKLKEFNYKFHNNVSKIDEYEKEPAYKRLGVELSTNQTAANNSRISVGTDSNNDLQLRSNNSYLHDNVD